ncbi:HNH endonuclease [Bdellovibrio sp. BCCA]|uniref:HNH endonuclease n=1 Tax=Bdellovibrio sp. BCCA TaxID=3136281 RepID=UPI0030F15804
MDLSKVTNSELLVRLEKLVRTERKITHLILCHINEVEARRLYAELGFDSMFKYLTKHLGYGEDSAYRRLQAARVLKQVPTVAEKLEEGSLNLTQLTQVQKCIKQEIKLGNKVDIHQTTQILEEIQNKSSFETQKYLAQEFNLPIQIHEVIKPQQDNSVRLEITFTEDQMKTLQQAKDLLSHVLPDGNWAELITLLAEKHIQKEMGKISNQRIKPPKRIIEANELEKSETKNFNNADIRELKLSNHSDALLGITGSLTSTHSFLAQRKRKNLKVTLKRALLKKANQRCEYTHPQSGKKCESTYQLQIDHLIPLAVGGLDTSGNLRVLCRAHNLHAAQRWGLLAIKDGNGTRT